MAREDLKFRLQLEDKQFKEQLSSVTNTTKALENGFNKLSAETAELGAKADKTKKVMSKLKDQIKKTGDPTGKLAKQLNKTEKEFKELQTQIKKNEQSLSGFRKKLNQAKSGLAQTGVKATQTEKKLGRLRRASLRVKKSFGSLVGSLKSSLVTWIGLGVALAKITSAAIEGVRSHLALRDAFASVNTLFADGVKLSKQMEKNILAVSVATGQDARSTVKAYYDIVSAGFQDQAKALEVLEASSKFAVVGITDISGAADVLTSVMNAWGKETYTAAQVTDILFATVQKGKTTVAELSQNLGQITSLAAKAGLSLEETSAAISTMTVQGVKTNEAMTLMKGILTSLIKKEGKEAADIVEKLGYEWSVASLKAKGLTTLISDLSRVTGGNVDELGKLIPNIRGSVGAITLLSNGGKELAENLEYISDSAGVVNEKMKDISQTMSQQIKVATQESKQSWRELGEVVAGVGLAYQKTSSFVAKATKNIIQSIGWVAKAWLQLLKTQNVEGVELPDWAKPKTDDGSSVKKSVEEEKKLRQEVLEIEKKETKEVEKKTTLLKTAGKDIAGLWEKAFDKLSDGIEKIREQTKKAISNLRSGFAGGFSLLGSARQALGKPNSKTNETFREMLTYLRKGEKTPQALNNLAQASKVMTDSSRNQQEIMRDIISKQAKATGGNLSAEGIKAIVTAVTAGLKQDDELIGLAEQNLEERIIKLKEDAMKKEMELFHGAIESFKSASLSLIDKRAEKDKLFAEAVEKNATIQELISNSVKNYQELTKHPIEIKLTGEGILKEIDAKLSQGSQNRINLTRTYGNL